MTRDLRQLPKGHLHLHLEGAMRPGTLAELCHRDGTSVPVIESYGNFGEFSSTYIAACEVLRTPDDLARLIDEVVEDAANDGCVWIEPAFYPTHHVGRLGGSERELWDMALEFGAASGARHGVGVAWLGALDRTESVTEAQRITEGLLQLVNEGAPIVAFGLHNDETDHPGEPYAEQFAVAGEAGLLRTPHAGELGGADYVRAAIDVLGADRIQHGVRCMEDPALVERIAAEGVVLDVCPTSNVMLSVVDRIEDHPLPQLLEAGVRCSVNGDDPLLFGPGILEEYELCRDTLGLSDKQLAAVARTSIEASAAPDEVRSPALDAIDAWLAS